jgi:hypothetical protein
MSFLYFISKKKIEITIDTDQVIRKLKATFSGQRLTQRMD